MGCQAQQKIKTKVANGCMPLSVFFMTDVSVQSKKVIEPNQPSKTRTQRQSTDNEENPSRSIPSFECSDSSSDSSSDMSDNEQTENQPTEASHNVTGKGDKTTNHHNLHTIVQEYKSPEKQTGSVTVTPVLLNRSKLRTASGDGSLHIRSSLKDLQKSLTPELKAARDRDNELASRSPSPKTRNRLYRNKKIDLHEKNSSKVDNGDKEELTPTLQPDDGHGDDGGQPSVKDRQAKKTRKQKSNEAEAVTVKPNKGIFVLLNLLQCYQY